jgi:hypothetical protein
VLFEEIPTIRFLNLACNDAWMSPHDLRETEHAFFRNHWAVSENDIHHPVTWDALVRSVKVGLALALCFRRRFVQNRQLRHRFLIQKLARQ